MAKAVVANGSVEYDNNIGGCVNNETDGDSCMNERHM